MEETHKDGCVVLGSQAQVAVLLGNYSALDIGWNIKVKMKLRFLAPRSGIAKVAKR